MARRRRSTPGLETLLDLDGQKIVFSDRAWVKFEARLVDPTIQRPHGIEYNLTYHDSGNRRLIGFDNTHGVQPKRRRFRGRRVVYDHRHVGPQDQGRPYEFDSPEQLLIDFWATIDAMRNKP